MIAASLALLLTLHASSPRSPTRPPTVHASPAARPSPTPHPSPAASSPAAAPQDDELRAALRLLYDGSTDAALDRFAELERLHPEDAVGFYLDALAFAWKVEQRPDSTALDRELLRRVERAAAVATACLSADPGDVRALLARGGAWAVKSRLHLLRYQKQDAARAAAAMRGDLLAVTRLDPRNKDALFGLGLYDYYADVLPRLLKLVRFFMGIPGGDRERGLREMETAREGSLFHDDEARAQLYVVYAYYEKDADRALDEIRGLRQRFPDSPLWALQLAEHLRERVGLFAESARVAADAVEAAGAGRANYAPVTGAMARLALGEALLLDLRPEEARRAVLPLETDGGQPGWLGARARLVVGRSLEMEGERAAAQVPYRLAARERATRAAAEKALRAPLTSGDVESLRALAQARREREAARPDAARAAAARALAADPGNAEAALIVAEIDLDQGRAVDAGRLDEIAARGALAPWLRAWATLLTAEAHDLLGQRQAALQGYKKVFEHPFGRSALRERAAAGIERPFTSDAARPEAPASPNYSR